MKNQIDLELAVKLIGQLQETLNADKIKVLPCFHEAMRFIRENVRKTQ